MNNNKIEELMSTMLQLGKLMSHRQQEHGMDKTTMFQFITLQAIKQEPDVKVSGFCQNMKISKSSATQLIERLVKAGFIKRIRSTKDRRVVKLVITDAGEKELRKLRREVINKMKTLLSRIPERDVDELIRIHKNLIEVLNNEQNK